MDEAAEKVHEVNKVDKNVKTYSLDETYNNTLREGEEFKLDTEESEEVKLTELPSKEAGVEKYLKQREASYAKNSGETCINHYEILQLKRMKEDIHQLENVEPPDIPQDTEKREKPAKEDSQEETVGKADGEEAPLPVKQDRESKKT